MKIFSNLISIILFLMITGENSLEAKTFSKNRKKVTLNSEEELKEEAIKKKEVSAVEKLAHKNRLAQLEGEGHRALDIIGGKAVMTQITCPICETIFKVFNVKEQISDKGIDKDFCRHSYNKSFYDYDLWCCPTCGYTNHKNFFKLVNAETFKKEREEITRKTFLIEFNRHSGIIVNDLKILLDQTDIPTTIKHTLLMLNLESFEFPENIKADLFLRYAFTERFRFIAPVISPSLSTPNSIIRNFLDDYMDDFKITKIAKNPMDVLDFLDKAKQRYKDNQVQMLIALHQASQYDRLGFPSRSFELLNEATKLAKEKNSKEIISFKRKILQNEIKYVQEGLISIKKAIKASLFGKELPKYIYLCGELHRRLRRYPESLAWLQASKKIFERENNKSMLKWSNEQLALLPEHKLIPKISDIEDILINKALFDYDNLVNPLQGQAKNDSPEYNFDPKLVEEWLNRLDQASSLYYKQFEFDPENFNELFEIGLLASDIELSKIADRFFVLDINYNENSANKRYKITTNISFNDSQGPYWLCISNQQVIKTRD